LQIREFFLGVYSRARWLRWRRILLFRATVALALLPLLFVVLHAVGVMPMGWLQRMDDSLYDWRLRTNTEPVQDDSIVIVGIDEKSLAEVGRWPWPRDRMGQLVNQLFEQQHIAMLGFNMVFADPQASFGSQAFDTQVPDKSRNIGRYGRFEESMREHALASNADAVLAQALRSRPVALGYFFSSNNAAPQTGVLPPPVFSKRELQGHSAGTLSWNSAVGNLQGLSQAAATAGFLNYTLDSDNVVRALPMLAQHQDRYYEALSLAMFRLAVGATTVTPGFADAGPGATQFNVGIDQLQLRRDLSWRSLPLGSYAQLHIPFKVATFDYVSATDLLNERIPADTLKNKIVLVGTTALGLQDLRATPSSQATSAVEIQAQALSALLKGHALRKPDYAQGYEAVVLLIVALFLYLSLPRTTNVRALAIVVLLGGLVLGLNWGLYRINGLVLPQASALAFLAMALLFHIGFNFALEHQSKRALIRRFGTYVPPELVKEMVKNPKGYALKAKNEELSVMFCDLRDFSKLSEQMEPIQLQALLNDVFTRLTVNLRANRATIDKYIGDCVMAFWGAPVQEQRHAHWSVQCALDMVESLARMKSEYLALGFPSIEAGIGINTGRMCVGDMGSNIRRSYTVIGAEVNLAARLESLTKVYGVPILASDATRQQAPAFLWQAIDRIRLQDSAQVLELFQPLCLLRHASAQRLEEQAHWTRFLQAYRAQAWPKALQLLHHLQSLSPNHGLYLLYAQRIDVLRHQPFDPTWDSATQMEHL
jgi:adenylate cyclase